MEMNSIANTPTEQTTLKDQPSVDERRALIERVAASVHFRRSARLRDFLLYVGGQSLKDGCPEINEQEIGSKVFGRPSSYDRSQDNIVRVNATELRKRIELYFASEGAQETLLLEIPRGGYKPIFHRRLPGAHTYPLLSPEALPTGIAISPEPVAEVWRLSRNRLTTVLAMTSLALAIVCVVLLQQDRSMRRSLTWEGRPAVGAFWSDFLRYGQPTDIVLSDDSVSLIED